jgi:hypothetical protein
MEQAVFCRTLAQLVNTMRGWIGRLARIQMMRRALAAVLLSVMAFALAAPVTCAGWEATPSERMACCQRAGHECTDQVAADNCCAQQEQAQQPAFTASASANAIPVLLVALWVPTSSVDAATPDVTRHFELLLHSQHHAPPGAFALPLRI